MKENTAPTKPCTVKSIEQMQVITMQLQEPVNQTRVDTLAVMHNQHYVVVEDYTTDMHLGITYKTSQEVVYLKYSNLVESDYQDSVDFAGFDLIII